MTSASRTPVAVAYALGAAGPREILAAAGDDIRPVFVFDRCDARNTVAAESIVRIAEHVDLSRVGVGDAAAELAAIGVSAVVTYSESMLGVAAELARRLYLPFHSPPTVAALTNKLRQRTALVEADIPCPAFRSVASPAALRAAASDIGLPAVLKPVVGAGSGYTFRLDSEGQLETASSLAWPAGAGAGREYVLETMLVGHPHPAADWLGDYISVETIAFRGSLRHFAVADKPPLAWPFRETGMILPSSLPADLVRKAHRLADRAVRACGITDGAVHTEMKITPVGLRIIEVNGRLGGSVAKLVRRISDLDPVRMALDVALGRRPRADARFRGLSVQYIVPRAIDVAQAPSPHGRAALRRVPGVYAVDPGATRTSTPAWLDGTLGYLYTVWAEAASLDAAREILVRVDEVVADVGQPHPN